MRLILRSFVPRAARYAAVAGSLCAALAQTPFTVSGRATFYGDTEAGPGEPPVAITVDGTGERAIQFREVTGAVSNGVTTGGPDGRITGIGKPEPAETLTRSAGTLIRRAGGFSGIAVPGRFTFLAGVFVGRGNEPPAPGLIFLEDDAEVLSPALGQTFYIGDGRARSGNPRTFRVPEGATRLLLGITDACTVGEFAPPGCYSDNSGSYSGEVVILKRSCRWVATRD